MKSHRVPAIGRPAPLRGFAGDGDLVIAVARLIADHGAGASLAGQAVAHSVARGFAFNRKLELPATAGGMACHCAAPSYMGSPSPNGSLVRLEHISSRSLSCVPYVPSLELLPKAKALRPDVPVIMITAYGDEETKRRALESGAEALLTKPIDFGTLRSEIDMRVERAA